MLASYGGHVECLRALLDKADVNRTNKYPWKTALMLASENGHVDCVRALINAGATDDDGGAMIWASNNGHNAVLKLLIQAFKPQDFAMAVLQWSAVSCAKVQMDRKRKDLVWRMRYMSLPDAVKYEEAEKRSNPEVDFDAILSQAQAVFVTSLVER